MFYLPYKFGKKIVSQEFLYFPDYSSESILFLSRLSWELRRFKIESAFPRFCRPC